MLKVRIVAPARDVLGFRLAGFDVDGYDTAREAETSLRRALSDRECGVLLMDEALMPALDVRMQRRLSESGRPVVIAFPMGVGAAAEKDYLERLIRRVIGYQVKLR